MRVGFKLFKLNLGKITDILNHRFRIAVLGIFTTSELECSIFMTKDFGISKTDLKIKFYENYFLDNLSQFDIFLPTLKSYRQKSWY